MKKILLLAICCLCAVSFSQTLKPLAAQIARYHDVHATFQNYQLFERADSDPNKYPGTLSQYASATVSLPALEQLQTDTPETMRLSFPFNEDTVTVELYRTEITTPDFKVQTDKGYYTGYTKGIYYRGIIVGDNNSLAVFSFFKNHLVGVVSSASYGDINIGKLSTPGNVNQYIIYSSAHLLIDKSLKCETSDTKISTDALRSTTAATPQTTTKCVRLYYEVGNAVYSLYGGIDQTLDWMTSIHNNVSAAFANDGISNMPISEVFIWTTPEPFEYTALEQNRLPMFARRRYAFNGDVAGYIDTASGGYAQGLNLTCNAFHGGDTYGGAGPYFVSESYGEVQDFPLYSLPVRTASHEIGHVLGSNHTHACIWNGNNTQIDDCGNLSGEGWDCYDPANPIIPELFTGTIMSYCGAALSAGFGPQPAQVIINTIENAPCFGTDCVVSCRPSIERLQITEVGLTSAKLTIVDQNPNASSWKFRILPNDFVTITSNPFIIEGLAPKSKYGFEVQQVCDAPFTANYVYGANIHTSGVYCDEVIVDYVIENQGTYSYQTSLHPSTATQKVAVSFNYVRTELNSEGLYIHDGPDIDSPVIGYYTGEVSNTPTLISSHPTGVLTLEYMTDEGYYSSDGFSGTVSCVNVMATESFAAAQTDFSPNPVMDYLSFKSAQTILSIKITDMLGRTIRQENMGLKSGNINMGDYAKGNYFAIISFEDRTEVIRVIKK